MNTYLINIIKKKRKELNLSQTDLARKIKVPQSTIGRIESGFCEPSLKIFEKIIKVLNLSLDLKSLDEYKPEKRPLILPKNYKSKLNIYETQDAIEIIKASFQEKFKKGLNLKRVTAPLFVSTLSNLNDGLSGKEKAVSFKVPYMDNENIEIVHSLAKWKRKALHDYAFHTDEGLYTDMNAIRKDEGLDNLHSIYVDQWDWEKIISKENRTFNYLYDIVRKIVNIIADVLDDIKKKYPQISVNINRNIKFLTSQELLNKYQDKTAKEREYLITKEYGTVFVSQIGKTLNDGTIHDSRAKDYDDWDLNGDIIFFDELLDCSFEISSMGIRVNADSLKSQMKVIPSDSEYHQNILKDIYPLTIGGGIGQSRLCMLLLEKAHIGEVQSSIWDEDTIETCKKNNIFLL